MRRASKSAATAKVSRRANAAMRSRAAPAATPRALARHQASGKHSRGAGAAYRGRHRAKGRRGAGAAPAGRSGPWIWERKRSSAAQRVAPVLAKGADVMAASATVLAVRRGSLGAAATHSSASGAKAASVLTAASRQPARRPTTTLAIALRKVELRAGLRNNGDRAGAVVAAAVKAAASARRKTEPQAKATQLYSRTGRR